MSVFQQMSLKRQGRKHKQFFEKMQLYPYPVQINGQTYFLINYLKAKATTGSAVISLDQESADEAKKAHRLLFPFYVLHEKINTEGRMRAGINIDFFRSPLELMDANKNASLKPGYDLIDSILELQLKYRKTYDNFQSLLKELESEERSLTDKDLQTAAESAAMLDVLQYQIVHTLGAGTKTLRNWIEAMKQADLWEKLTKAQQVFYQQMLQNEELMLKESKNMPVVKHENFDKMLKLNLDKMKSYKRKEQQEEEAALRHP
ncbi:hypothetical protein [Alkalicoccus daliensis]|uniref:Uncharacterized protein n=1 Tax=Alkalicoccus daliensis TaxID=745820 RepID=A0A1H0E0T5_9BACI|nr:hypothetical protein [Alkalicoccus daliensis]SDN75851.1 hypothetical protein SAMN04488053_103158 [Alkalicoccus daliensis]